MKRWLILMPLLVFIGCTANLNSGDSEFRESDIIDAMDNMGNRYSWYCGSEGVSVRSVVRVAAMVTATIFSLGDVPNLCERYNSARAEAIQMLEAEREALQSGLLDQQEGTVNE